MRGNFLVYRHYFWLKITLVSIFTLMVSYIIYSRETAPYGGTVVGLTYGAIGLLVILLHMFFWVRKRWHHWAYGTLQGWLSFHIYTGVLV
ncbi:MAG: hypothetical protein HY731_12980, partial [Candidatus Tectomicrobia bacterium]|nr:hypothetical protein [Candidatus Tectomicrobia bacterium]